MQNEERINGLETQVRTLKRIVYGFGCLLVAGVVVSATSVQTVPDVIQAKKFEVVNDEGKVLVSLSNLIGGGLDNGMLTTRTSEGQKLVELGAGKYGGNFGILNKDGKLSCLLGAEEYGGIFGLLRKNGKVFFEVVVNEDGGMLSIANKEGKPNPQGIAPVVVLKADQYGGTVGIANNDGEVVAGIAADKDGNGVVRTMDSKGQSTSTTP